MTLGNSLRKIKSYFLGNREIMKSSRSGYRIWSESFDNEKDNLMLTYDEIILNKILTPSLLQGKSILDFGCGTGRNWHELLKYNQ